MKRFVFLLIFTLSIAFSQQHFNHLKINGVLHDEIGPFYFINYGNSHDAYVLAKDFAKVLGLEYSQNDNANLIYFSGNGKTVSLKSTTDISTGLLKRPDIIYIPNKSIDSPMAIIVDGKIYAAITPILNAFGGDSPYNVQERTLYASLSLQNNQLPIATAVVANSTNSNPTGPSVGEPRIGRQEDGSTRLVFDLPVATSYQVTVKDGALYIVFNAAAVTTFDKITNLDPNIIRVQSGYLNNMAAIVINPNYAITMNSGYKYGLISANSGDSKDRLYFDFHNTKPAEIIAITPTVAVVPAVQIMKKIVMIDAGHGGYDPGAVSAYATESKVVLSIALELSKLLEAQGIEVILTRDDNQFLALAERSEFATPDINLFVSIHANSSSESSAHGIETWVFGEPLDSSMLALANLENGGGALGESLTQEALSFAQSIGAKIYKQEQLRYSLELADSVQKGMIALTGARDRGVRENAWWVIRKSRTPAILVEVGFLSNPTEGSNLATIDYQIKLATGLANGIVDFLNNGGLGE